MSSVSITTINSAAVDNICRANQVSYLGIFGSSARGDNKKTSDVDFLIDFSTKKSLLELMRVKIALEKSLGKEVDLVPRASLKPAIAPYVQKDLRTVYEEK